MKKVIMGFSVLILSSLVLAACGGKGASSSSSEAPSVSSSVPVVASSASARMKDKAVEYYLSADKHSPLTLAFDSSMPDIPFISMSGAKDLILAAGKDSCGDDFKITLLNQAGVFTLTRDNGSTAVFDFPKKTLTFSCFEAFTAAPYASTPLDPVSLNSKDSEGKALYIERQKDGSFYKVETRAPFWIWLTTISRSFMKGTKAISPFKPSRI